jgi:hypothetical protein
MAAPAIELEHQALLVHALELPLLRCPGCHACLVRCAHTLARSCPFCIGSLASGAVAVGAVAVGAVAVGGGAGGEERRSPVPRASPVAYTPLPGDETSHSPLALALAPAPASSESSPSDCPFCAPDEPCYDHLPDPSPATEIA